jgi:hypothetical protein
MKTEKLVANQTVILDSVQITHEIALQHIAVLNPGYNLVNGELPKGQYFTYLQVISYGNAGCVPATIIDMSLSGLELTREKLTKFSEKLEKIENMQSVPKRKKTK